MSTHICKLYEFVLEMYVIGLCKEGI